ncbi:MAG: DUF945 family protein [Verrucomicrobiota bacterium]
MKKAIISGIVLVVVVVLLLGSTWFLGAMTEDGVKTYFEELDSENPVPQLSVALPEYKRGFLKSSAMTSIGVEGVEEDGRLKHDVYHGPIAITPDGMKAGMAYIITTLDQTALPEEAQTVLSEVYGEEEPFTIKTTVSLTGGRTSLLEVASVNYAEDELDLRFDGATGSLEMSGESGPMEAELEISPFSMKSTDEAGDVSTLRLGSSSISLSGDEMTGIAGGGTVGKVSSRTTGDEGISFTMEESTLEMDHRTVEEGSALYVGEGTFSIPEISVNLGEEGKVAIKNLEAKNGSQVKGDMVEGTQTYTIESIEETFLEALDLGAVSDALGKGVSLTSSSTMPIVMAEAFAELQSDLQAWGADEGEEMSAEDSEALADALELSIKSISEGTGMSMDLRVGDESKPMSVGLSLAYVGKGLLTETESIAEIIELVDLELNAELPNEIIESLPEETGEQVGMLIVSGTFVETPTGLKSSITLKDGALLSNGEPNPLFESMKPMLMMPMDWDGVFDGIRAASEE